MKKAVLFFSLLILVAACEAGKSESTTVSTEGAQAEALTDPFIHSVYFWFKEGVTEAQKEAFIADTKSMKEIEVIKAMYTGTPAETFRPIVERSYDFSVILHFENKAGHDVYQEAPLHLSMIEKHSDIWEKVMVLDMD